MSSFRVLRLYFRLLGIHLRGVLEHPGEFWIMVFAALLTQVVNLVFLQAIFTRIPDLNGWSFWPIVVMFGLVSLGEGICSLFFEGMWRLAFRINQGELDYMLVRPYPVALQVTSAEIGLNGLGNITAGFAMLVLGLAHADITWTAGTVAFGLVLFVSAMTVKVAISFAANAVSFWVPGPNPLFAMAVHQGGELTRYPLTLYPAALQTALCVVVPFAFVSFFPATFLIDGQYGWVGLLTPVVAVYCLLVSRAVFRRGLLRYESTGN